MKKITCMQSEFNAIQLNNIEDQLQMAYKNDTA